MLNYNSIHTYPNYVLGSAASAFEFENFDSLGHNWLLLFNSPKPWRVLVPSFPFFCKFFQLVLLPFHFILFPFFLYWTSKPIQTRLGTLFLSGILSPNLASFSPKPFGHVQLDIARSLAQLLHNLCRHELLISLYFTISVTIQPT